MKAKLRGLLGALISVAVVWWLIKESNIDWALAWGFVKESNKPLLICATIVANMMFPLRARRWRPILHEAKPNIPFGPLWRSTAIGMMANTLLPFRMGEIARAYALTREEPDIPISASIASLFVDRIFDAVVVVILLVVALYLPDVPADTSIGGRSITSLALIPAIGAFGGLAGLYALAIYPGAAVRIATRMAAAINQKLAVHVEHIAQKFTQGLGSLRTPRRFAEVFFWAMLHWLAQPLAFWIGFRAFGIHAPFAAALIAQFTIVVLVAVPSAPGYVGLYEAGAAAGLLLFGVDKAHAFAWAVTLHVVTLVPITLIGLYYVNRDGFKMSELKNESEVIASA